MSLVAIFFYLFSILCVASAAAVIVARNPVHAVLFLILAFFNAAGLFVLLGAQFLALLIVIVYVGAVAVLFLFVVMMLDVDFAELKAGFISNAPIGLVVAGIVLAELVALFAFHGVTLPSATPMIVGPQIGEIATVEAPNIEALGRVLYTKYVFFFQTAGLILLVAMIGAIVLTLRHKPGVKRQNISRQIARTPNDSIEIVKVPSGGAILPSAEGQG